MARPPSPHQKKNNSQTDQLRRHRHWLERAKAIASSPQGKGGSPHPSVKVGAILVDKKGLEISHSSNRFALGVNSVPRERHADGTKSLWYNCAEQLVLAEALKEGAYIKGASLYSTLPLCAICAGLVIESGIKSVVVPLGAVWRHEALKDKWHRSIEVGLIKLQEAGVKLVTVDISSGSSKTLNKKSSRRKLSHKTR